MKTRAKNRGFAPAVLLIVAVALIAAGSAFVGEWKGGASENAAIVRATTTKKIILKKSVKKKPAKSSENLAELEREIIALYNDVRSIGPEHYARLRKALDVELRAGTSPEKIRQLLEMLGKVNPDNNITSTQPFSSTFSPKESCTEGSPILIADITTVSLIQKITAPGTASYEGPKGHSFIWTGGAKVPVYAPIAGIYDSGSFSRDTPEKKAQYLLFFRVKESCGYQFKFDHIDEPVASIRAQLSVEPKIADSRSTPASKQVEFKTGELIGYTSGNEPSGNWDFGLYNTKEQGALKTQGCYGMHCNAVCWSDFYTPEKKTYYRALLEGPKLVCSF